MRNNIKKMTPYLDRYEYNVLLPIMIKGLEMKKGKMNAVTNKQIVYGLRKQGLIINEARVRKLINYIRTNDLVESLMASSIGYYITDNERELISYEKTLLSREVAIRNVRMSIIRQRRKLFAPVQLTLF